MASKGFTIITRDNCYWCHKAKELMDEKQMTYIELHIPNSLSVEEFQSLTEQYETTKTVPKIFFGSTLIGGYDDLVTWIGENLNE